MTIRLLFAATLMLPPLAGQVKYEDILRGANKNWLTYSGDYASRRHSPLDQINPANVKDLALKWVFPITHYVLEVTPVVIDGVMFVTGPNQVYALDARAGRTLWHYQRPRSIQRHQPWRGCAGRPRFLCHRQRAPACAAPCHRAVVVGSRDHG